LPAGVWVLGFGSLLMDASSEMIHSLLPLFLVGTLGLSVVALGLIEGLAEATALAARVLSGVLSDWLGRRKRLMVLGYALSAAAKPLFALATGAAAVTAARVTDRIGKGIRGAPRDALLADITEEGTRGAAFGLRQTLDSVGALAGPLLATLLMLAWAGDVRAVFWVATLPALAAVVLLAVGVREAAHGPAASPGASANATIAAATAAATATTMATATGTAAAAATTTTTVATTTTATPIAANPAAGTSPLPPRWREALHALPRAYWIVVALAAVFMLSRFSEAFLVLRAQHSGVAPAWVPLVMVVMSAVYAAAAYPFGKLADRVDRRRLLAAGMVALIAADVVLALAARWPTVMLGVGLWGLHMGMTQGLFAAMVADAAPQAARGTAFGVFHLAGGLATLAASALAGLLWQWFGPAATFGAGAVFAFATLLGLFAVAGRERRAAPGR
jgi:MFS family permease